MLIEQLSTLSFKNIKTCVVNVHAERQMSNFNARVNVNMTAIKRLDETNKFTVTLVKSSWT